MVWLRACACTCQASGQAQDDGEIIFPEVGKCLPEVKMCLPEVEMMFAGSGDVLAGSGDVVAGSGNVVEMDRELRVFWEMKIQACGGSFLGLF